ncbi:hypothetical protein AOLI_G00252950 [Acnodon oligacanthus]
MPEPKRLISRDSLVKHRRGDRANANAKNIAEGLAEESPALNSSSSNRIDPGDDFNRNIDNRPKLSVVGQSGVHHSDNERQVEFGLSGGSLDHAVPQTPCGPVSEEYKSDRSSVLESRSEKRQDALGPRGLRWSSCLAHQVRLRNEACLDVELLNENAG